MQQTRTTQYWRSRIQILLRWNKAPFACYKLWILSTRSMTSKALILSILKSITGTDDSRFTGKGSFRHSRVGEWLLLLLSLWYSLNLVFVVSNSWLLLIPGVSFLLLTSRSISWSSMVNVGDAELGLCDNWIVFWLGERIGDIIGDLVPPLAALDWLTRWWSHTTSSRIYDSVFSLSAWWSVSILINSVWPTVFLLTSDLTKSTSSLLFNN